MRFSAISSHRISEALLGQSSRTYGTVNEKNNEFREQRKTSTLVHIRNNASLIMYIDTALFSHLAICLRNVCGVARQCYPSERTNALTKERANVGRYETLRRGEEREKKKKKKKKNEQEDWTPSDFLSFAN